MSGDDWLDVMPDGLYVDIESEIHMHMGHDGQSDEANDWVTDIMSAISPLIVRELARSHGEVLRRLTTFQLPDHQDEPFSFLPGTASVAVPPGTEVLVVLAPTEETR